MPFRHHASPQLAYDVAGCEQRSGRERGKQPGDETDIAGVDGELAPGFAGDRLASFADQFALGLGAQNTRLRDGEGERFERGQDGTERVQDRAGRIVVQPGFDDGARRYPPARSRAPWRDRSRQPAPHRRELLVHGAQPQAHGSAVERAELAGIGEGELPQLSRRATSRLR